MHVGKFLLQGKAIIRGNIAIKLDDHMEESQGAERGVGTRVMGVMEESP